MSGLTISPPSRALAIRQVTRIAEHAADGRDAVCGVKKERALDGGIRSVAAGDVRVHLGEPRHQELALAVDARRASRNLRLGRRRDRRNPAIENHHGLVREDSLSVHRNHTDADKRGGYGLGIGSRRMAAPDDPCQHGRNEDLVGLHDGNAIKQFSALGPHRRSPAIGLDQLW